MDSPRRVVANVGLASFAESAAATPGVSALHLDWRPPADGDVATARRNAMLFADPRVDAANVKAVERFLAVEPVVVGVRPASSLVPGLGPKERRLLHAGPPIGIEEMCGPMVGALIGAVMLEAWSTTPEGALAALRSGEIALDCCHHHGAVGPMAGVISPSMPLWIVEDGDGRRSFSNLNEGLGKVLRFGAHSDEVLSRLRWMAAELGPAMGRAFAQAGGLALKPIIAQALHMGDEVHNRNAAATGQFLRRVLPSLLSLDLPTDQLGRVVSFVSANDHFFLNLSMAAAKLRLDAAAGIEYSSVVTAMARNGVRFGIRLSGTGDEWFEAPANTVNGLYFSGFGPSDAAPDLGDSAITETSGLGGFSMAAAPAIVQFVGGTPDDALANTVRMHTICVGVDPGLTIPMLNFGAVPAGIDARLVVDSGTLPIINTGIAHRDAGVGQIGAGITTAPSACFTSGVNRLAELLGHDASSPIFPRPFL